MDQTNTLLGCVEQRIAEMNTETNVGGTEQELKSLARPLTLKLM
jgi:hypothetical protein